MSIDMTKTLDKISRYAAKRNAIERYTVALQEAEETGKELVKSAKEAAFGPEAAEESDMFDELDKLENAAGEENPAVDDMGADNLGGMDDMGGFDAPVEEPTPDEQLEPNKKEKRVELFEMFGKLENIICRIYEKYSDALSYLCQASEHDEAAMEKEKGSMVLDEMNRLSESISKYISNKYNECLYRDNLSAYKKFVDTLDALVEELPKLPNPKDLY